MNNFSNDELLLFHGLLLMANADGNVDHEGLMALEAYVGTVPDLKDKDFDELLRASWRLSSRHGSLLDSVQALSGLKEPGLRLRALTLMVDVAMSTGELNEHETRLLDRAVEMLGVDEQAAVKVVSVLNLKYRR